MQKACNLIFLLLLLFLQGKSLHPTKTNSLIPQKDNTASFKSNASVFLSLRQSPRLTLIQNDPLPNELSSRVYVSWKENPQYFYKEDEDRLSASEVRQYVAGGWVRWLTFIDETYEKTDFKTFLFRLVSRPYSDDFQDVLNFQDHMVVAWVGEDKYTFCSHDAEKKKYDICRDLSFQGHQRENVWHFILVMYDYDNKKLYYKIKLPEAWLSGEIELQQIEFDGYIGLYLGADVVKEGRSGFNGDLDGWNMLYGKNFLDKYLFGDSDEIILDVFRDYEAVPYIENRFEACNGILAQKPGDFSSFTFINSFLEATDYGFALWLKLKMPSQDEEIIEKQQILTLAFENRSEINTLGKAIAQIYLQGDSIFAEVAFEQNNTLVSVPQKIIDQIDYFHWNFIQVHFSGTKSSINAWVVRGDGSQNYLWKNSGILVPKNVYLTIGTNEVIGRNGGDFKTKRLILYAGNYVLYGDEELSLLERNNQRLKNMKALKIGKFISEAESERK